MIVFNRPEETRLSFDAVRNAAPRKLFVIADGPRVSHPGEAERCAEVQKVFDDVDWECDVERIVSSQNLGCKQRVVSGLDHVFAAVEEAIILEDDCVPSPGFFTFCDAMLQRYRHDDRVGTVAGTRFGPDTPTGAYSFSRYPRVWGWASWRRAWEKNDPDMLAYREEQDAGSPNGLTRVERLVLGPVFESVARGEIDTWDYQWMSSLLRTGAVTVVPPTNLVSNIGFSAEATHTTAPSRFSNLPTGDLGSFAEPARVEPDRSTDGRMLLLNFSNPVSKAVNVLWRCAHRVRSLMRRTEASPN